MFNSIKALENHLQDIMKNMPNEKERSTLKHLVTKYKGEKSEGAVQQYLKSKLRHFIPKVLLGSYKRERFCGFFKDYQCEGHRKGDSQEFDIISILGQCKAFIVLEIKNELKFSEKDLLAIHRTLDR